MSRPIIPVSVTAEEDKSPPSHESYLTEIAEVTPKPSRAMAFCIVLEVITLSACSIVWMIAFFYTREQITAVLSALSMLLLGRKTGGNVHQLISVLDAMRDLLARSSKK